LSSNSHNSSSLNTFGFSARPVCPNATIVSVPASCLTGFTANPCVHGPSARNQSRHHASQQRQARSPWVARGPVARQVKWVVASLCLQSSNVSRLGVSHQVRKSVNRQSSSRRTVITTVTVVRGRPPGLRVAGFTVTPAVQWSGWSCITTGTSVRARLSQLAVSLGRPAHCNSMSSPNLQCGIDPHHHCSQQVIRSQFIACSRNNNKIRSPVFTAGHRRPVRRPHRTVVPPIPVTRRIVNKH